MSRYREIGANLRAKEIQDLNHNFSQVEADLNNISGAVLDKVIEEAQLNWREPVNSFSNLATSYPTPQIGWTAMARDTGKVFRYNGTSWVEIQQIDAGPVNEVDSRLTRQLDETNEIKADKTEVLSLIGGVSNGTPLFATNIAGMTDTSRNYVNTTDGLLYRYNGTSWISTGVQYQSTGIPDGGVTTNKIADGAGSFRKRTRLGEKGNIILASTTTVLPNVDTVAKTITFSGTFFIINGNNRYTVTGGITLSYADLLPAVGFAIHFNVETNTLAIRSQTVLANIPESNILIATLLLDSATTSVLGFDISCEYTINGLHPTVYYLRKTNGFTSITPTTDLAVVYISTTGEPPDYNTVARTLVFPSTFFIVHGKRRYTITGGVTLDFSGNTASAIAVYYNTVTGKFQAVSASSLTSVPDTSILIALLHTGNTPLATFKGLYITCPYTVDGKSPYGPADGEVSVVKPYLISNDPLIGEFEVSGLPACDGTDLDGFDHRTVTHVDVYDAYDSLVSENTGYITKHLSGLDSSGVLPINYYHFKPKRPHSTGKPLVKIIIGTGAHGDGWTFYPEQGDGSSGDPPTSVFSLFYLMKNICENWHTNSLLEYLRFNVEFIIVPLQNPWGFDNHSRYNSNGVDLNRNYDLGWASETSAHKGTAPFSENETQYMRDLIRAHADAVHFIDWHTISINIRAEEDLQLVITNSNTVGLDIANLSIPKVSRLWRKKAYGFDPNIEFYGRVDRGLNDSRPIAKNWAENDTGMVSVTMEGFPATSGYSLNSSKIIDLNTEFIANWLINVLRYFQNN